MERHRLLRLENQVIGLRIEADGIERYVGAEHGVFVAQRDGEHVQQRIQEKAQQQNHERQQDAVRRFFRPGCGG